MITDESLLIKYPEFAKIAAEYYLETSSEDYYEMWAEFREVGDVDDHSLMNGLTKYHLLDYFRTSFTLTDEAIDVKEFMEVVIASPSIVLTAYEVHIVSALCTIDERNYILWKEFVSNSYTLLYTLCKQRFLFRRLSLYRFQRDLIPLKHGRLKLPPRLHYLGTKLLNLIQIELKDESGDVMTLSVPKIAPSRPEEKKSKKVHYRTPSIAKCFNKTIPLSLTLPVYGYDIDSVDVNINVAIYQHYLGDKNKVTISIHGDICELGTIQPLHLKIPSVALIDESVAEKFAMNAVLELRVEMRRHVPQLVVD
jgi:hypothetical protein